jgi:hypothetical protein
MADLARSFPIIFPALLLTDMLKNTQKKKAKIIKL